MALSEVHKGTFKEVQGITLTPAATKVLGGNMTIQFEGKTTDQIWVGNTLCNMTEAMFKYHLEALSTGKITALPRTPTLRTLHP